MDERSATAYAISRELAVSNRFISPDDCAVVLCALMCACFFCQACQQIVNRRCIFVAVFNTCLDHMAPKAPACATVLALLAKQAPHGDTLLDSQLGDTVPGLFDDGTQPTSESDILAQQCADFVENEDVKEGESQKEGESHTSETQALVNLADQVHTVAAVDDLSGMFSQVKPVCSKCLAEVDAFRAQIKGKTHVSSTPKWLCNSCNSKLASLSRSFGKWPIPEFQELSVDEQKAFWKDTSLPGVNLQKMKSMLLEKIVKSRTDKVEASIGGSWLPLGVYAVQGYDIELIKKNCKGDDIKECPLLGTTYRVPISFLGRSTTESRIRESILKSWGDVARTAQAVAATSAKPALVVDELDDEPRSFAPKADACVENICESMSKTFCDNS